MSLPANISITAVPSGPNTNITISWSPVAGVTTFDLLTFSEPRNLQLEQFRVVTGLMWTITVPTAAINGKTIFHASVRGSTLPKYGAITINAIPSPAAPSQLLLED